MVLKGVRVLDISTLLAGAYCAMILGEMGAEEGTEEIKKANIV